MTPEEFSDRLKALRDKIEELIQGAHPDVIMAALGSVMTITFLDCEDPVAEIDRAIRSFKRCKIRIKKYVDERNIELAKKK